MRIGRIALATLALTVGVLSGTPRVIGGSSGDAASSSSGDSGEVYSVVSINSAGVPTELATGVGDGRGGAWIYAAATATNSTDVVAVIVRSPIDPNVVFSVEVIDPLFLWQ